MLTTTDGLKLVFEAQVKDSDGDTSTSNLFMAESLATSTPIAPVVLDLGGDGFNFLSRDAGVGFDYAGTGQRQTTGWAGGGDGILAFDFNQDGDITLAKEFVFTEWAPGAATDLEALALRFDTNHDGLLSALDAEWSKFGLWIDANSNAVSEEGEYVLLSDLGIRSINLTYQAASQSSIAAGGDVRVAGTALFTWEDGRTGQAADALFMADLPVIARAAAGPEATAPEPAGDPLVPIACTADPGTAVAWSGDAIETVIMASALDLLTGLPLNGSVPAANPLEGCADGQPLFDCLERYVDTLVQQIGAATADADWQALIAACWGSGGSDPRQVDPPWQGFDACLQVSSACRSLSGDQSPLV